MIHIDLEDRLPTDTDIPGWSAWSKTEWAQWLAESERLRTRLAQHHAAGEIAARNAFIDEHSAHWGKLKPWLHALSGGKCWFSDTRDLYSHYDVEHFRPKKEAKSIDKSTRDGYWWLAFDYTNFRLCGNVGNRKKGGWFPLQEGSLYSSFDQQREESETPYLLDPIDLTDVNLLAFDEEGKAIPIPKASAWEQQRVVETVKRLKLNEHAPLGEERRKVWQQMDGLIEEYQLALSRNKNGGNPAAKEKARKTAKAIKDRISPTAELSSVAKYCLWFRNDEYLNRLIS